MKTIYISLAFSIIVNTYTQKTSVVKAQEKAKLFVEIQKNLEEGFNKIKNELDEDYHTMREVARRLGKQETLHSTALAAEQVISTTKEKISERKKKEKLEKLHRFLKRAIDYLNHAHDRVMRHIKEINKELDRLLGNVKEFLADAHLAQAQKLVNEVMSQYSEYLRETLKEQLKKDKDKQANLPPKEKPKATEPIPS